MNELAHLRVLTWMSNTTSDGSILIVCSSVNSLMEGVLGKDTFHKNCMVIMIFYKLSFFLYLMKTGMAVSLVA